MVDTSVKSEDINDVAAFPGPARDANDMSPGGGRNDARIARIAAAWSADAPQSL